MYHSRLVLLFEPPQGIFFAFMVNLVIVSYVDDSFKSWRILTNTVLIPTIPLLTMIYLMPESPRYLMKHGRYRKALESFTMIQTTPLLASRDFMYAHAQLDFESRLLSGKANERGNLAERIAASNGDIPVTIASRLGGTTREHDEMLQISISPAQPVMSGAPGNASNGTNVARTGIGQQRPTTRTHPSRGRDIELSSISRCGSDTSSLDIELAALRVRRKENPYFYHIGVTGYFKRLRELWSNKRCRRALLSASIAMITQYV